MRGDEQIAVSTLGEVASVKRGTCVSHVDCLRTERVLY